MSALVTPPLRGVVLGSSCRPAGTPPTELPNGSRHLDSGERPLPSSGAQQGRESPTLPPGAVSDTPATSDLFALAYQELRAVAGTFLRRERNDHTLAATALVHEAFLRLQDVDGSTWRSRSHFLAVAIRALRRVLINHAETKNAKRRGGGGGWERVSLDPGLVEGNARNELDVLALHEALEDLSALDERQARVVELRFFGGLTVDETARVLGVSPRTVDAEWSHSRAWLATRLSEEGHG